MAERIRSLLAGRRNIEEKRMFGGLAFMLDGHMSCGIVGDALMARVGTYKHVLPNQLILGAGMHRFEKAALAKYRESLALPARAAALRVLCHDARAVGYAVGGATLKRSPAGHAVDPSDQELWRHQGLWLEHTTSLPKQLRTSQFTDYCLEHFDKMAPVHHWLRRAMI